MTTPAAALLALAASAACSVGEGVGSAIGPVYVPLCGIARPRFSLDPTFFGGDFHAGSFTIRLQHSGDNPEFSDELTFLVTDTGYVRNHLGQDLPVGLPGEPGVFVHATLGLNRSCGRISLSSRMQNAALQTIVGTIRFTSIYNGASTDDARERITHVERFSLRMLDPRRVRDFAPRGGPPPDLATSWGELEGTFTFFYARGRPAQRFP